MARTANQSPETPTQPERPKIEMSIPEIMNDQTGGHRDRFRTLCEQRGATDLFNRFAESKAQPQDFGTMEPHLDAYNTALEKARDVNEDLTDKVIKEARDKSGKFATVYKIVGEKGIREALQKSMQNLAVGDPNRLDSIHGNLKDASGKKEKSAEVEDQIKKVCNKYGVDQSVIRKALDIKDVGKRRTAIRKEVESKMGVGGIAIYIATAGLSHLPRKRALDKSKELEESLQEVNDSLKAIGEALALSVHQNADVMQAVNDTFKQKPKEKGGKPKKDGEEDNKPKGESGTGEGDPDPKKKVVEPAGTENKAGTEPKEKRKGVLRADLREELLSKGIKEDQFNKKYAQEVFGADLDSLNKEQLVRAFSFIKDRMKNKDDTTRMFGGGSSKPTGDRKPAPAKPGRKPTILGTDVGTGAAPRVVTSEPGSASDSESETGEESLKSKLLVHLDQLGRKGKSETPPIVPRDRREELATLIKEGKFDEYQTALNDILAVCTKRKKLKGEKRQAAKARVGYAVHLMKEFGQDAGGEAAELTLDDKLYDDFEKLVKRNIISPDIQAELKALLEEDDYEGYWATIVRSFKEIASGRSHQRGSDPYKWARRMVEFHGGILEEAGKIESAELIQGADDQAAGTPRTGRRPGSRPAPGGGGGEPRPMPAGRRSEPEPDNVDDVKGIDDILRDNLSPLIEGGVIADDAVGDLYDMLAQGDYEGYRTALYSQLDEWARQESVSEDDKKYGWAKRQIGRSVREMYGAKVLEGRQDKQARQVQEIHQQIEALQGVEEADQIKVHLAVCLDGGNPAKEVKDAYKAIATILLAIDDQYEEETPEYQASDKIYDLLSKVSRGYFERIYDEEEEKSLDTAGKVGLRIDGLKEIGVIKEKNVAVVEGFVAEEKWGQLLKYLRDLAQHEYEGDVDRVTGMIGGVSYVLRQEGVDPWATIKPEESLEYGMKELGEMENFMIPELRQALESSIKLKQWREVRNALWDRADSYLTSGSHDEYVEARKIVGRTCWAVKQIEKGSAREDLSPLKKMLAEGVEVADLEGVAAILEDWEVALEGATGDGRLLNEDDAEHIDKLLRAGKFDQATKVLSDRGATEEMHQVVANKELLDLIASVQRSCAIASIDSSSMHVFDPQSVGGESAKVGQHGGDIDVEDQEDEEEFEAGEDEDDDEEEAGSEDEDDEAEPEEAEESTDDLQARFSGSITAIEQLLNDAIRDGWLADEAEATQIIEALRQGNVASMYDKIAEVEERLGEDDHTAFDSFSNMADEALDLHSALTKRGVSVGPQFKDFKAGRGPSPEVTGKMRAEQAIRLAENQTLSRLSGAIGDKIGVAERVGWLDENTAIQVNNAFLTGDFNGALLRLDSVKANLPDDVQESYYELTNLVSHMRTTEWGQIREAFDRQFDHDDLPNWLAGQNLNNGDLLGYVAGSNYEEMIGFLDGLPEGDDTKAFADAMRATIDQAARQEIGDYEHEIADTLADLKGEGVVDQGAVDQFNDHYRADRYDDARQVLSDALEKTRYDLAERIVGDINDVFLNEIENRQLVLL